MERGREEGVKKIGVFCLVSFSFSGLIFVYLFFVVIGCCFINGLGGWESIFRWLFFVLFRSVNFDYSY